MKENHIVNVMTISFVMHMDRVVCYKSPAWREKNQHIRQ